MVKRTAASAIPTTKKGKGGCGCLAIVGVFVFLGLIGSCLPDDDTTGAAPTPSATAQQATSTPTPTSAAPTSAAPTNGLPSTLDNGWVLEPRVADAAQDLVDSFNASFPESDVEGSVYRDPDDPDVEDGALLVMVAEQQVDPQWALEATAENGTTSKQGAYTRCSKDDDGVVACTTTTSPSVMARYQPNGSTASFNVKSLAKFVASSSLIPDSVKQAAVQKAEDEAARKVAAKKKAEAKKEAAAEAKRERDAAARAEAERRRAQREQEEADRRAAEQEAAQPTRGVHPGAFCSDHDGLGLTSAGTPMVCSATATDDRYRWRRR